MLTGPNRHSESGLTVPLAIPLLLAFLTGISVAAETWRGIVVAPEYRCSLYEADDYSYSPSLEARIVSGLSGKVYGPYTGRCFSSSQDTDIEHIVARSEAHDSGLCAADAETKRRFARNLLNLTLANPRVNRYEKRGKDAAEWLPNLNQCRFAARIVEVRRKYDLTIDRREAEALERVLSACPSTEMVMGDCAASGPQAGKITPSSSVDALYVCGTIMGMEGLPASRRGVTASHPCGVTIRHTPLCATLTGMLWSASEQGIVCREEETACWALLYVIPKNKTLN